MPTTVTIARCLAKLIAAGYPHAPPAEALQLTTEVWAEDLAALNDAELEAAVATYRRSPEAADRWWPTPGRILGLSSYGQVAASIGSAGDGERAFEDFHTRLKWLIGMRLSPSRHEPNAWLDPVDAYRNDAMFVAWEGYPKGDRAPDPVQKAFEFGVARKAWIAAYVEARRVQARDPAAVRETLRLGRADPIRLLPEPK